jgi:hypothetical protein
MILDVGCHSPESGRLCAMEWVSWALGQPHSDDPRGVGRRWAYVTRIANDLLDPAERDQLVPHALDLVGRPDLTHDDAQHLTTRLFLAPTSPERLAVWQQAVGPVGRDWVPNRPASPSNGAESPAVPTESPEYAR